jgi:hypothetical protein
MSISCKKATELVSKREEGNITLKERYQLLKHISACYLCKFFATQNKQITKSSKKYEEAVLEDNLSQAQKSKMISSILESEGV